MSQCETHGRNNRDSIQQFAEQAFNESGGNLNPGLFAEARKHHEYALQWDDMMRRDEIRIGLNKALNRGDSTNAAQILGEWLQGSENITGDRHLLNAINKYLPEGTEKYKSLREIPIEDLKAGGLVEDSLMRRLRVKAGVEQLGEEAVEAAPEARAALEVSDILIPQIDYVNQDRYSQLATSYLNVKGNPEAVGLVPENILIEGKKQYELELDALKAQHRGLVFDAINRGEQVPDDILKDYPEFRNIQQSKEALEAATAAPPITPLHPMHHPCHAVSSSRRTAFRTSSTPCSIRCVISGTPTTQHRTTKR